jgi:hypothetical protein
MYISIFLASQKKCPIYTYISVVMKKTDLDTNAKFKSTWK